MTPADKLQFAATLRAHGDVYRVHVEKDSMRIFWQALAGFELSVVEDALNQNAKNSRYFPVPAEIVALANAIVRRRKQISFGTEESNCRHRLALNHVSMLRIAAAKLEAEEAGFTQEQKKAAHLARLARHENLISDYLTEQRKRCLE